MSTQAPTSEAEPEQDKQLNFFMKILEWFLNLFGLSMKGGAGAKPFDDNLIKENREEAKKIATKMADHPMAKTIINMALKIPAVANMAREHLDSNPELKKLTSEVISENEALRKNLAGNKRFMDKFSDLMPKDLSLHKSKEEASSADASLGPDLIALAEHAAGDNSLQAVVNEAARDGLLPQSSPSSMSPLTSTAAMVTAGDVVAAAPASAGASDTAPSSESMLEAEQSTSPQRP